MTDEIRIMTLQELTDCVAKYHTPENAQIVKTAWEFAEKAHNGQKRKSGEPYFCHPAAVATTLAELMMDGATIAAGLLHDCVEDVPDCTLDVVQQRFGAEVAALVDGVTKLNRINFTSREEQKAESLRKMILAMSKDIRVVVIKLADRLHNMRTLGFQPADRQHAIAQETLDIYAPLAHRLGMYAVKSRLEDLSFRYLYPEEYSDLAKRVGLKRTEREQALSSVIEEFSRILEEKGIPFSIDGRPKHLYSIYRKMHNHNIPFEQIYDLIALRVIVDTIADCYAVLGLVHAVCRPVPNRFKDYIASPKANMYQSLHTTVVGQTGLPFEVQIRTKEMHQMAEFGIAAHWRYKEGRQSGDELDAKLYWLRSILDWQNDTKDAQEFVDLLKTDLFADEVFAFTPNGDIINMPRGATPLDFAYRIHSAVGNKCIGAKVNGRIVTLDSTLNTGDFVEIITSSAAKGPSRDWMQIVKTTQAKTKIRQWFKRELKQENVELGHSMLLREAQRNAVQLPNLLKPELYTPILRRYTFLDLDDVFASVGVGALSAASVVARLIEEQRKLDKPVAPPKAEVSSPEELAAEKEKRQQIATSHGVYIDGDPNMLVRFAHCCNPVPGDEITGYVTRGRGVTVHKADCINVHTFEPERIMHVSWTNDTPAQFNVDIQIVAYDHDGLLASLATLIGGMSVPIESVTAKVHKNGTSTITLKVKVENAKQVDQLIIQLKRRADILEVFRLAT